MILFTLNNFYVSDQWRNLVERLRIERVDADGNIICAECGKPIIRKYDCVGHHIEELTEDNVNDALVSLNPDNVELIHFRCHNAKHGRFDGSMRAWQGVYLVYGSPCAGKTTWVKENANADDLVVDIDALWAAVCTGGKYDKRNRLKANVFALRDVLIEQIRMHVGMWRFAYVIGGYPLRTDRDRLCSMLRARPIFIDTDMQTCMERAENDDWKGYVSDWFEAYTE